MTLSRENQKGENYQCVFEGRKSLYFMLSSGLSERGGEEKRASDLTVRAKEESLLPRIIPNF